MQHRLNDAPHAFFGPGGRLVTPGSFYAVGQQPAEAGEASSTSAPAGDGTGTGEPTTGNPGAEPPQTEQPQQPQGEQPLMPEQQAAAQRIGETAVNLQDTLTELANGQQAQGEQPTTPTPQEQANTEAARVAALNAKDAIDAIKALADKAALEALAGDSRVTVATAAKERLAALG